MNKHITGSPTGTQNTRPYPVILPELSILRLALGVKVQDSTRRSLGLKKFCKNFCLQAL